MKYRVVTGRENPAVRDLQNDLIMSAWPEFMMHDIYIAKYWWDILIRYPEYQYILLDDSSGKVLGLGNSFPLIWNDSLQDLPETGLDGAIKRCHDDIEQSIRPNFQCAFQIIVDKSLHGTRFSYEVVKAMIQIGRNMGLETLVAPVRPNQKSRYPLTPIEKYAAWIDENGNPFDGWMRVHTKLGAEIVKVCPESMLVEGSVADWEKWTEMKFPESGRYVIPGALNPIKIDRENDLGEYIEPNVWMAHRL